MCYTDEKQIGGGASLKKYMGFLVAASSLLFTAVITLFAKRYGDLLDAFYPYFSRTVQKMLASVSSIFPFLLWQVIVVGLVIACIATLIRLIVRRRSFLRWLGWWLAVVSLLWTFHTSIHGLNFYAGSLAEDLHMEMQTITQEELEQALIYFRDQGNELAAQLPRDAEGNLLYDDFDTLAKKAGNGYENLVQQGYSVFAGSTLPVKKLGWGKMYNAMGICGVTMAVTGEAAVVADMPSMAMPFVMCHEMAHRMAIASESDANFAAFLACRTNEDIQFQYSAYYMAYRYCRSALGGNAAAEIHKGASDLLKADIRSYNDFYAKNKNQTASSVANAANNSYIQASGDSQGVKSYGMVATQLVNWYLQQTESEDTTENFDPLDKEYINGILGENNG